MAIKVDRPMDSFGDGIVAYVAKSQDEVDQIRAGFQAAGVPVDLPEAAIEAWFASGKDRLEIRVAPENFRAASNVIDELFPPEELILPDEPVAAAGDRPGSGGGGPGYTGGPSLENLTTADAPTRGSAKQLSQEKLKGTLLKVMFIAAIGAPIPGVGLALGAFGLWGAIWGLKATDRVVGGELLRGRASAAIAVACASLLINAGACLYVANLQGWL